MPKNKKKPGPQHPRYQKQNAEEADCKEVESSEPEEVKSGAGFSRRKITNNWAKYEQQITFDDSPQQPADHNSFTYLLQNSSSDTSYFQLAAEREWESQDLKPEGDLFSLDLKLISSGLACLPFYERIGIDVNLLSPNFVKSCDSEAKTNLLKHKPTLDSHRAKLKEATLNNFVISETAEGKERTDRDSVQNQQHDTECARLSPVLPVVDSLPSSSEKVSVDSKSTEVDMSVNKHLLGSEQEDDLEDWLDSVLDK